MASYTVLGVFIAYLLVLLGLGIWGRRESGSVKGYYLAGKKLPAWVIAFSSNATGESGWLLLGLTGMGYLVGIHALWVVLGEVLATAFAPVVLCALFWKRTTLPGAIAGMAGGFVTTVIWVVAFKAQFYDLYEMLPGFVIGGVLTILVSLFTTPPEGIEDEFDEVQRAVKRGQVMPHQPPKRFTMNRRFKCLLDVLLFVLIGMALLPSCSRAQERPRARDLGVPFDGTPGPFNAITDVQGVEVGHTTLIKGDGALVVGEGPVRTGVTAILPRGKRYDPVFAGWYSLNGNGEMTGTTWVEESGFLGGPVMITNTHSVGVVRDAVVEWLISEPIKSGVAWALPVVAETYDGFLNDINGFHEIATDVKLRDVYGLRDGDIVEVEVADSEAVFGG